MMNGYLRWFFLALPLLASVGCSDPVPPSAKGGVTLSIQPAEPPVAQTSCPAVATVYQVGAPDAPTAMTNGVSLINGDQGSTISCSVHGTGPYTFSGTLKATTKQMDPITVSFSGGTVDADQVNGTANVQVFTPQLVSSYSSSAPCKITVQQKQIKAGHIWATFQCDHITDPSSPSNLCAIGSTSTIVFENCDGS